ncbi:MAG: isochorismatase [Rhodobiaceae bacterium]|nr:isochorismatase [Rhodobiaceae bacterium]
MTQPTFIDAFTQPIEINPSSTALIVVDMQNATGNRTMGLGKLLAEGGKAEQAVYRFDRIEQLLVPNIQKLLTAFRDNNWPVIYVTYGAETPDSHDVPQHLKPIVTATNNIEGQKEHEIVADLTPLPNEPVLNKTTMGAFCSTKIDTVLRATGVDTLVCVGVSTNNCVGMTAMEACDLQYKVIVVSDATGTDSQEMQDSTLNMLGRLWARIMTTDEVVSTVKS